MPSSKPSALNSALATLPRSRLSLAIRAGMAMALVAPLGVQAQNVDLSQLGTTHPGFRIDGIDPSDFSGVSVSGAGDVNGDGLADLIVGAFGADSFTGESYVVFGKADGTAVDLANLGSGGFRIDGIDPSDRSGISVSGAGDVNGDGLADLIVSAYLADPGDNTDAGESYVVFGKTDATPVDLASLGSGGFRIDGIDPYDYSGRSVSGAGDVNGDGLADLIVGAYGADPGGDSFAGESYVVFGKADAATVDLAFPTGGGFRIDGIDASDVSGLSVSGAGDVNGDGLADLIIGAYAADVGGDNIAGESYVVFGKADATAVDLASLSSGGFRIDGVDPLDQSGRSVSGAGDVNGDGLADLIVGAPRASTVDAEYAGQSYVVFGKADNATVDLAFPTGGGFRIDGIDIEDLLGWSVSGAGDVDGDGLADLIVGARFADPGGDMLAGESYVVFGKADGAAVDLANLGSGGFRIDGIDPVDISGTSVSGAGDVNGDGLADLIIGAYRADVGDDSDAGESYVVFSNQTAPASASYAARIGTGDAPAIAVGVTGDGSNDSTPDARTFIDYQDGDNVSTETVTLNRNNTGVTGTLGTSSATIHWELGSDRSGVSLPIDVSFRYTDAEITGLTEGSLTLYRAAAIGGPYDELVTTVDAQRNRISAPTTSLGFFIIGGQSGLEGNESPVATADSYDTTEDDAFSIAASGVLANDTDPDGDSLSVAEVNGTPADVGMQITLASGATLTLNGDGSFDYDPNGGFESLADGGSDSDSFTYTVSDGSSGTDSATVTIDIDGLNDAPTAGAVSDLTTEGGSETVGFAGADPDTSDTLSYTIATGPSEGRIVNNGDGSFDFFTDADFEDLDDGESRAASATYVVSDGTATSDPADITMTVQGVNDAPVAGADNYTVGVGQTLTVDVANGLLANDSDIENDPLSVTAGTFTPDGIGGSLTLNADGSFEYTPPADTEGVASYEYTVSDGEATGMALLTIAVSTPTTADLQIDKTDGVEIITPDHVFDYQISVFNAGPADAIGAAVQDLLPAELGNVSWSCEAIGAAACGSASGIGDIQELVDIPSGDAVIFELTATVTGAAKPIVNTATVAAPVDLVDEDQSNNSATDTDLPVLVYRDGFESPAVRSQSFAVRHATLTAQSLVVPADGTPVLVLRAQDSGQAELALALVHARRVEGRTELRISRLEHGQWALDQWRPVTDTSVELRW